MIPTIDQFNSWSLEQRIKWILEETNGRVGRPGFIFYEKEDVTIIYSCLRGKIIRAVALSFQAGVELFISEAKELKTMAMN